MRTSNLCIALAGGVFVIAILTMVVRVGLEEWRDGRKESALFGWALALAFLLVAVALVLLGLDR
jgi:hypothetical protein